MRHFGRGKRLHRRDRGLWADGSHRWVLALAIHTNVCKHGRSSEHCTGKRHVTECEALCLLVGASGLTGQTGASGQTGLTGGFRLAIPCDVYSRRRGGISCEALSERSYRPDRGLWADGSHRWVQALAILVMYAQRRARI